MAKNEIQTWIAVAIIGSIVFVSGFLAGSNTFGKSPDYIARIETENKRLKKYHDKFKMEIESQQLVINQLRKIQQEIEKDFIATGNIFENIDRLINQLEKILTIRTD